MLLFINCKGSHGQLYLSENFDWASNYAMNFYVDTINNPTSVWQIGHPNKLIIDAAFSGNNSIITDTENTVPANDTSSFYFIHFRDVFQPFFVFVLQFKYNLDGDVNDRGMIEISPDVGNTWYDLLELDSTAGLIWITPKPDLKGNSGGWQSFDVDMMGWDLGGNIYVDTILFRFTYITNNSVNSHDGWAIDDFILSDYYMGVNELRNDNMVSIYPNPVSYQLTIERKASDGNQTVQILNYFGQKIYHNSNFKGASIEVSSLENGIYFLRYSDKDEFSIKRFVVQH